MLHGRKPSVGVFSLTTNQNIMTVDQIIEELKNEQLCELETENSCLDIWFRVFFGTKKSFHFQLNGKPVYGCTTERAARRKIQSFLDQGFKPIEI